MKFLKKLLFLFLSLLCFKQNIYSATISGKIATMVGSTLTPLKGSQVTLLECSDASCDNNNATALVITDSTGTYTFKNVEDGTYRVEASSPGYSTKISTTIVDLTKPKNLILVPLPTGSVEGQVLFSSNAPVTNLDISIQLTNKENANTYKTKVDKLHGDFAFDKIPYGNYEIEIIIPRGYQIAENSSDTHEVTINDQNNDIKNIDFNIEKIPVLPATKGSIEGNVYVFTDDQKTPATNLDEDIAIQLKNKSTKEVIEQININKDTGAFVFEDLDLGTYIINIDIPTDFKLHEGDQSETITLTSAKKVSRDNDFTIEKITSTNTGSIEGKIFIAKGIDAENNPQAKVDITVGLESLDKQNISKEKDITDGTFKFESLPYGKYEVSIKKVPEGYTIQDITSDPIILNSDKPNKKNINFTIITDEDEKDAENKFAEFFEGIGPGLETKIGTGVSSAAGALLGVITLVKYIKAKLAGKEFKEELDLFKKEKDDELNRLLKNQELLEKKGITQATFDAEKSKIEKNISKLNENIKEFEAKTNLVQDIAELVSKSWAKFKDKLTGKAKVAVDDLAGKGKDALSVLADASAKLKDKAATIESNIKKNVADAEQVIKTVEANVGSNLNDLNKSASEQAAQLLKQGQQVAQKSFDDLKSAIPNIKNVLVDALSKDFNQPISKDTIDKIKAIFPSITDDQIKSLTKVVTDQLQSVNKLQENVKSMQELITKAQSEKEVSSQLKSEILSQAKAFTTQFETMPKELQQHFEPLKIQFDNLTKAKFEPGFKVEPFRDISFKPADILPKIEFHPSILTPKVDPVVVHGI